MKLNNCEERSFLLKLVFVISLFQIAAAWLVSSLACVDGPIAQPQPDTTLYFQAARRIVEGAPFSFSEGTAVCTGTTTVIYPFVLAIPYAMGFTGDSMLVVGFLLNAFFFTVFAFAWCFVICRLIDRFSVRLLASCLVAASGHCAFVTFSQSDIGFWLAVSGLFFAALVYRNQWMIGFFVALIPWARPEGMICNVAYAMITAGFVAYGMYKRENRLAKGTCLIAALGIVSVIGVFVFNYLLTGHFQFSSVSGKGYLVMLPFTQAVYSIVGDMIAILKGLFLGLPNSMPRDMIAFPFISGVFLLAGFVAYQWKREDSFAMLVMLLTVFGAVANVSTSGWQGTNLDRYLVWIFPVLFIFIAIGAGFAESRISGPLKRLPSVLLLLFAVMGSIGAAALLNCSCKDIDRERHFAHACMELMPDDASVGGNGGCGFIYFGPKRRMAHLYGIYSPEFSTRLYFDTIEKLRNEPQWRFDYWLTTPDLLDLFGGEDVINRIATGVLSGPMGETLLKADWSAFEPRVVPVLDGKSMVDKIEIGYDSDERGHAYRVIPRWGYTVFDPFIQGGDYNGRYTVDVGRVVLGGDEMTVSLEPGKDVRVVLRLWPSRVFNWQTVTSCSKMDCSFSNPLKMNLSVDGEVLRTESVAYKANGFSEVTIDIPGSVIRNDRTRIGFLGDHIVFGYWFYQ